MIRIAVVDDEEKICIQVEEYLISIAKEHGISIDTDVYFNGKQLCEHLDNGELYDLIFLDIEMDGFSGLEVSESIRNVMKNESTQIAYISGKQKYAIDVFDYDPLYFSPKPLDHDKVEKVFLKLIHKLNIKAEAFSYKAGHDTIKIAIKDIIYFESDDHTIKIHFYEQYVCKSDNFYGSLDNIQQQLEKYKFLRIHKTYLVNSIHIKKYTYEKLYMSTNRILPIAQSKRKEIRLFQLNDEDV